MENATQNRLHGLVLELLRVGISVDDVLAMLSIERSQLVQSIEYLKAIKDSDFKL